jgi:hypothetical protein
MSYKSQVRIIERDGEQKYVISIFEVNDVTGESRILFTLKHHINAPLSELKKRILERLSEVKAKENELQTKAQTLQNKINQYLSGL